MAVILPILSTFNAAGIKSAQSSLLALGKSLGRLAGPIGAAVGGFNAIQASVRFAGEAISEARDLERNMAALGTVFGGLEPRMKAFAENAYSMGLSQVDAARTATFLGSVLKQAGLPMDQVAQKTEELTVLAQDLATTYGYDTSEALTAMTALFRGEYDPIEKFGVALKQNEVNALVAAKGLGHLTGQEMLNAQQTVRMEQLFLRSADAAGAFARQSGTLFVEQKKLTAVFNNMQAAVGERLTPAITDLMQALTPVVNTASPQLISAFDEIGKIIDDLVPIVKPLGEIFGDLVGAIARLLGILEPLIKLLASSLAVALELVADLLDHVGAGLEEVIGWFGSLWMEADKDWGDTQILDWFDSILQEGTLLKGILGPVIDTLKRVWELSQFGAPGDTTDETSRMVRRRLESLGAIGGPTPGSTSGTDQGKSAKNVVADFYKELQDEMEKQSARLKLKDMGASEAFIDSIVGSGDDWRKVFNRIKATGTKGIAQLQRDFSKTAAGIKEIQDAYEKSVQEYDKSYALLEDAYDKQKAIYDNQVQAINDLKKALRDSLTAINPLAVVTREIGAYEQTIIDSFANIAETITKGVTDGTLLKDAAASLTSYAKSEQDIIQKVMRQRDELFAKRTAAKALMDDIRAAVLASGNVTELLAKNTTDVTQTITKMVGNVQVATSKVIKGVTGGSAGLITSFKETLAKTKEFAQQLKNLRALGLDKNIYQQIVTAGVDAGGATAKAILEGGTGTVSELNSLFTELDNVGMGIAEQSAQVMYGAGIDIIDGLINGMISKEQTLVDYAQKLADSFTTAFTEKMNLALPTPTAPVAPAYNPPTKPQTLDLRLGDIKLGNFGATKAESALAAKIIASPLATAWTTTINVNAGVGTNGKAVGQAIYSELLSFAKANGIKI